MIAGSTSISASSWQAVTLTFWRTASVLFTNTFANGKPSGVRSWYPSALATSASSSNASAHAPFRNVVVFTSFAGVPHTGTK